MKEYEGIMKDICDLIYQNTSRIHNFEKIVHICKFVWISTVKSKNHVVWLIHILDPRRPLIDQVTYEEYEENMKNYEGITLPIYRLWGLEIEGEW